MSKCECRPIGPMCKNCRIKFIKEMNVMLNDRKTDQDRFLEFVRAFVRITGNEYEATQEVNVETGEKGSAKISFELGRSEVIAKFYESGNLADIVVARAENDSR